MTSNPRLCPWLLLLFLNICFVKLSLAQEKTLGQFFFPTHENYQWLTNQLGEPASKATYKRFKKKFKGEKSKDKLDDLRGFRDGIIYNLYVESDNYTYYELNIQYDANANGTFPFLGVKTIEELEAKVKSSKDYTLVSINKEWKGGEIKALYHPFKIYFKIYFPTSTGALNLVTLSLSDYEREMIKMKQQEILTKTGDYYHERGFTVDPTHVVLFDASTSYYQIGNMLYIGQLKDGLPHGKARWGIFTSASCPANFLFKDRFSIMAEGEFKNGKPVGRHDFKRDGEKMFYVYDDQGIAKTLRGYNSDYAVHFNSKTDMGRAENLSLYITGYGKVMYSGKLNAEGQKHDPKGSIRLKAGAELTTEFVNGSPKTGAPAYFSFRSGKTKVTTQIDKNYQMNGKAEIEGETYRGTVYLRKGKLDASKNGQLNFDQLQLSGDLNGKAEVKGKIAMDDFGRGLFSGKDLQFSFAAYPETKFRGDLKTHYGDMVPAGKHTVTEYKNGVLQGSLEGLYTPNGSFLKGNNFYQKSVSIVYDSGSFTDSRNGESYPYITYIRQSGERQGELITWMLKDLYYEDNTNEIWSYNSGSTRKKKCYYSQRNAKIVCPRGWRLPNTDDLREIYLKNKKDKKYISNNVTLIKTLNLDRNGYVWRRYGKTELFNADEDVCFWLDNGYRAITKLNQGSNYFKENNDRYHTCRCVKDGAVEK